ncbi:MAG: hypothetical protein AAF630_20575 [Cyanobacteria bacterium P01_C01_bin.38]
MSKKHNENDLKEAAIFTAVGVLAAGVGVIAKVGGMDLAVAENAVFIGSATVIAAGAVLGFSVYGLKNILIKV